MDNSHWPIMFFFKPAAVCANAGALMASSIAIRASILVRIAATPMGYLSFTGVSAIGVNGGFPENHAFRLSTTS